MSCVSCHQALWEQAKIDDKTKENAKLGMVVQMIDRYMKSIHARPNMVDQSRTNATCYNCHDPHYVYPKGSPIREEWRRSLPSKCGACHDTEFQLYKTSVHGREVLEKHNPKAAICSDCHSTHDINSPQLNSIKLVITQNCGGCHKENLESYLETYHGQVNKLGYTYTAKCFDCHGSHAIQRVNDPSSRVSPENILTTCQQCHANATKGFTTFQPHANTHDFARYPYTWIASKFMLALLGGTLSFFWLHSALWYYRELREHQQGKAIPHVRTEGISQSEPGVYYRRWPWGWRLAHLLFAMCVIMLVFTGMTLFYADSFWAPLVQGVFGGPTVTGRVHRFFAVCFVAIFVLHLVYVTVRIARNWQHFPVVRPELVRSEPEGPRGCHRHVQVVLRPRPAAEVRPLDLLGEVRLLGAVLGRHHHRRERRHAVGQEFFAAIPARLGVQRRDDLPRRRSLPRRRVPVHRALLQQPLPAGEVPARNR